MKIRFTTIGIVWAWIAITSIGMGSYDAHAQHEKMSSENEEFGFVAMLSTPQAITAEQMIPLTIHIQDANGRKVTDFERFQEVLMHLIVVSEDLQFFYHLHPKYDGNGNFNITTSFPTSGVYTLFSDYKPTGQAEQVSVLKLEVHGTKPIAPSINSNATEKTVAATIVRLSVSPTPLKANEDTLVTFDLLQEANRQPVTDLLPYLGEKGHLVIIKQSPNLTRADYIHAHAMQKNKGSMIQFMTHFPQPGLYKLWSQFNRGGTIITADFWADVRQPGHTIEH